jgi:cation:H+ antiporter
LIYHFGVYILCFLLLWFGSKLVTGSVTLLAKAWKLPVFTISFFILGLMTSLPEISIGLSALSEHDPAIFAGNLLGGVVVLFFLIIPLLGVLSNGIKIPKTLHRNHIILTLIVVITPSLVTADHRVHMWEAVLMIGLYCTLFIFLMRKRSLIEKFTSMFVKKKVVYLPLLGKIAVGVLLLFIASHQIVDSTLYFAQLLGVPPFFVSLLLISLGTNIPEFTIIIRSVFDKQNEVALADYLGSASANTLLFGIFTLIYGETISLPGDFLQRCIFVLLGILMFFVFARSRNSLSRFECFVLIGCYFIFLFLEIGVL